MRGAEVVEITQFVSCARTKFEFEEPTSCGESTIDHNTFQQGKSTLNQKKKHALRENSKLCFHLPHRVVIRTQLVKTLN